ncbi:MAG: 4-alpha-glucanotransferase, partial [Muribaculaceae bacterium]|nr:4-alpha-glucanotransferase [Muribaculaceae bacterium]
MRITFNIDYRTNWGESLYICGDIPELGGGDQQKALPMRLVGAENWSIDVEISAKTKDFNYYYIVKPENAAWRFEWGAPHQYRIGKGVKLSVVNDRWQDMPKDKPYYSSAFVDGMLYRSCKDQALSAEKGVLNIRVAAPMIQPDEILALAGEGDALGNWDVKQAIRMNDANFPEWEANIDINLLKDAFEYKFVILKKDTSEVVAWEMCNNRRLELAPYKGYEYVVVSGMRFVNPLQPWKCAGTAIPTFSVRTEEDFGVGDFIDLKKMVDWCKMTGQKVLQLLPINDTTMTGTWTDSYPYNANSTFALHPMYIRLSAVGKLKNKERQEYYDNLGRELNQLADVDYERVNNGKK